MTALGLLPALCASASAQAPAPFTGKDARPPAWSAAPGFGDLPAPPPLTAPSQEKVYNFTRESPPAPPPARPVSAQNMQKQIDRERRAQDEVPDYSIQLSVPGLGRLTRLESEAALKERMRQEARKYGERLTFPEEPVLSKEPYAGRHWEGKTRLVEPYYLVHARLLFQQKNFERYGWDLGPITPLICAGKFYWDVATLPYHLGTRPCQQYETNAGLCLPGDPVPLLLYPPEISLTGLAAEGAVIAGLFAIFP